MHFWYWFLLSDVCLWICSHESEVRTMLDSFAIEIDTSGISLCFILVMLMWPISGIVDATKSKLWYYVYQVLHKIRNFIFFIFSFHARALRFILRLPLCYPNFECVYVYTCMYVCMYVLVYVCMSVCMYVCMYVTKWCTTAIGYH